MDADQTAHGTGQADETIVERGPAQARRRDGEIAEVREELELARFPLAVITARLG